MIASSSLHLYGDDKLTVRHHIINNGGTVSLAIAIDVTTEDGGASSEIILFLNGDLITKKPDFDHARALATGISEAVEEYVRQFPGVAG